MAKSKTKKVTTKELESVKELQSKINTILMNMGNATVVQNQLVSQHTALQVEWKDLTGKLEDKYGSVNISLEDGAISEIEKEEEKAPALAKA